MLHNLFIDFTNIVFLPVTCFTTSTIFIFWSTKFILFDTCIRFIRMIIKGMNICYAVEKSSGKRMQGYGGNKTEPESKNSTYDNKLLFGDNCCFKLHKSIFVVTLFFFSRDVLGVVTIHLKTITDCVCGYWSLHYNIWDSVLVLIISNGLFYL